MKKILGLLIGVIVIGLVTNSNSSEQGNGDMVLLAQEELSQRIEKINNIFNKYPGDAQLHLAAADLYRIVGLIPNEPSVSPIKEYQIAVKLEPKNRLARALLMKYMVSLHLGDLEEYYSDIKKANELEVGRIEIPKGNPLYEYLKTESGRQVMAENIRKSAASRRPELDKKTLYLLEELKKSEGIDPNNALYNYLSAQLYFIEKHREKAIAEIEKGLKKEYVSLFTKERIKARERLLDKIDFPSPERELFLTTVATFGLRWYLCDDLIEMGKEYQKNNKFNEAEKIYSMVVRIAEQRNVDLFFVAQELNALGLKQYGLQHLKELYESTKEEQKRNEVMNKLEKIKSRIKYLFSLTRKVPSYENISQTQSFINEMMQNGELETLKNRRY